MDSIWKAEIRLVKFIISQKWSLFEQIDQNKGIFSY